MEPQPILPFELWSEIRPHMSIPVRARLREVCKRLCQEDADLDEVAATRSPLFRGPRWKMKLPILCALVRAGFDRILAEHYDNQFEFHRSNRGVRFDFVELETLGTPERHCLTFKSNFDGKIFFVNWRGRGRSTCTEHERTETTDNMRDMMRFLDALFYWAQYECHECCRRRLRQGGCRFLHPREEELCYEFVDVPDYGVY
jgi:hypothetical protein